MSNHSQWLTYQEKDLWKTYLQNSLQDFSDVYFLPEYGYLHEDKNTEPCCYLYTQEQNVFFYPFLKSAIRDDFDYFDISTAYGYGGPLSNTKDTHFIKQAYNQFRLEAREKNIIAELIRFHPIINNQELMLECPDIKLLDTCPTVHVNIDIDEEHRWEKIYPYANRKNINKAKRNNVEIHFGKDETTWLAFQELYGETMTANQAVSFYYFSDDYYQRLRNDLQDNYILVSATHNDQIVSVLILLLGPAYAHCHRIGTKRSVMSLGINNYLHHETIIWCKSQGIKNLLIGGGRGNTEDDSLYQFKRNFSDVSGRFFIGESILNNEIYHLLCDEWQTKNFDKTLPDRLFKYRY